MPRAPASRNSGNAATAEAITAPDQWNTTVMPSVRLQPVSERGAPAQELEQVIAQYGRRQHQGKDKEAGD